ncbi:hypothetical protein KSF78_0000830, partial [Schistosoma japonicum]
HIILIKYSNQYANGLFIFVVTLSKYANSLIKIIYGILLTTVGFLLVYIQVTGKKTESFVFEHVTKYENFLLYQIPLAIDNSANQQVFLNFLLIAQFFHFLSFYAMTFCKICCSYCNCCLVDNNLSCNLQHLHYFPHHKSNTTDYLFSHKWNHAEKYRKRINPTIHFENRQLNIKHQHGGLMPVRDEYLISQSDKLQYHQLVTISNSVSLKSQLQNRNQMKRITTDFTHEDCYRILSKCEYIIQAFFCVGSLIIIMYYGDNFIKSFTHSNSSDIWYSLDHIHFNKSNTSQLIVKSSMNTDNLLGHENKYSLERDNSICKEYNISYQHTLMTSAPIISTNIPHIINQSSSYSTIFDYTIPNNQTNITSYNLSKVVDFMQITYTNYLLLINNALWILLTVMQIPVMIRLRKFCLCISNLHIQVLFVHVIAANLTSWFHMAYIGTENYFKFYRKYTSNNTLEINGSSGNFNGSSPIHSLASYHVNGVAYSHFSVVVFIWIIWNTRKLIKKVQDSENLQKKNRFVHWEKENSSSSPIYQSDSLIITHFSRSVSNFGNSVYCYYGKKYHACWLLSLSSLIVCSIHLFSNKLHENSHIFLCYFSYFSILVFTIAQIILLVCFLFRDSQSNLDLNFSHKFSKNVNWLKSNLLYFPLLFQLTGSMCFNLMQIIELLLNFANKYPKYFDNHSSSLNASILHNSVLNHATQIHHKTNKYQHVSQHGLFLKYFIVLTLWIEIVENSIEVICIPYIMIQCFLQQCTKSSIFVKFLITLITNEFCLLIMKFFNPQLLILEDNSVFNCSSIFPNIHNVINENTSNITYSPRSVTFTASLTKNTNNITSSQINLTDIIKTIDRACYLAQFSIISTNWWYWIFLKQLSQSFCFTFRQFMLICYGFLYLK